jgi:hypothetical protein
MTRYSILPAGLALAALLASCGGTLNTTGGADGGNEDVDTDFESDVTTEVGEDVPVEVVEDPAIDLEPDMEADPVEDPVEDPTTDPTTDPTIDSVTDTITDTTTDPTIDSVTDTTTDPTIDSVTDTVTDTVVDTSDPRPDVTVDVIVDYTEIGDATIEPSCTPGTQRCNTSGNLETCRSTGLGWDVTVCDYGCLTTGGAHCAVWDVSNIGMDIVDDGSHPLGPTNPEWRTGTDYVQFDTDTGEIWGVDGSGTSYTMRAAGRGLDSSSGIAFDVLSQSGGAPDIGVFSVTTVDIPSGVDVWTTGDNAFALAATGAAVISGTFNCKAYFTGGGSSWYPGPGGYPGSTGPGAGSDGSGSSTGYEDGGGGGASFGGVGGDSGPGTIGGSGGSTYGGPTLIPLFGGSGGGHGADAPGYGGPGGGACEIVSLVSITIASTGGVDAAGHGGEGGDARGGGGGGGAGGGLLLESPVITVDGMVAANGGGGGSGAYSIYTAGVDGERGHLDITAAAGGVVTGSGEAGCNGGDGNSASSIDGEDNVCEYSDDDGGGGGAGSGRIRINAMSRTIAADTLSPALSTTACTQADLPLI